MLLSSHLEELQMVAWIHQVVRVRFGDVFHVISRSPDLIQVAKCFLKLLPLLDLLSASQQIPSQQ